MQTKERLLNFRYEQCAKPCRKLTENKRDTNSDTNRKKKTLTGKDTKETYLQIKATKIDNGELIKQGTISRGNKQIDLTNLISFVLYSSSTI